MKSKKEKNKLQSLESQEKRALKKPKKKENKHKPKSKRWMDEAFEALNYNSYDHDHYLDD